MTRFALPLAIAWCSLVYSARSEDWKMPEIRLPKPPLHPRVAATPEELDRLRAAWRSEGLAHDLLAKLVADADKALKAPLEFPARGGQHNQWYQCDACQRALVKVDATHHKCPGCGKIYSGPPYDDVIFAQIHGGNLHNMRIAAWAYALTGDKKYAAFSAKVLAGYAQRYKEYPYHDNQSGDQKHKPGSSGGHLFEQTLNEAYNMSTDIGPAFDLIYPSLSEEERRLIREGLLLPMLENIAKHKAGKSNWQTWHNAGFMWGGACLDDAAWVNRALKDDKNGFLFQMGASVTGDGMWYENSWGYHFYTLGAMVSIAEGARRLDMDVWSNPTLRKMFTLAGQYAMADGSLPRFGDDVNSSARSARPCLEADYSATKDQMVLALLDGTPSFESIMYGRDTSQKIQAPPLTSVVFKEAGHAILRTQGPAGLTVAFTFSPFGGFHGHFDKLSFVFFGNGRELGVDPGRAKSQAYRLPIHGNWYRATIGHNAVLVDKKSQSGTGGVLECFGANERFAAVRARCDSAYTDLQHARLLVLAPEYLLVFDDLATTGKGNRTFDWLYHNRGTKAVCECAAADGELKGYAGGEYIKNAKSGETDKLVNVVFEDAAGATHLLVDAQPGSRVTTGDGPLQSVEERVPLAMITRTGTSAHFAAVIEPLAKEGKQAVDGVSCEMKDGVATITISRGAEKDVVTNAKEGVSVVRGGANVLDGKAGK